MPLAIPWPTHAVLPGDLDSARRPEREEVNLVFDSCIEVELSITDFFLPLL